MSQVTNRHPVLRIFAAPIVLAGSMSFGLIAGLLGDGIWDVVSWFALGLPLVLIGWYALLPIFTGRRSG